MAATGAGFPSAPARLTPGTTAGSFVSRVAVAVAMTTRSAPATSLSYDHAGTGRARHTAAAAAARTTHETTHKRTCSFMACLHSDDMERVRDAVRLDDEAAEMFRPGLGARRVERSEPSAIVYQLAASR